MGKTLDLNFTIRARGGKETAQTISLSADSVRRLSREISKTGDISRKSIGKSRGEFKLLSDQISQAKGLLIGFFSINAGLGLAKSILDVNREMEKLRTQLTSIEGSRGAGLQAFSFLQDFAKTTPFQLEELTRTFVKLKNFGIEPTTEVMSAITNQVSKLGGSSVTLQGVTLALGQAWAKGKLQAEEALQLIERGVPVYKILEEVTGKNAAHLQDMQQQGQLTRDVISQLITKMGEMASGSNAAQMDTLNGKISNLEDAWHQFEDALLNDKSEGLIKDIVSGATSALNEITGYIQRTSELSSGAYGQTDAIGKLNVKIVEQKQLIKELNEGDLLGINESRIKAENIKLENLLSDRVVLLEKYRADLSKNKAQTDDEQKFNAQLKQQKQSEQPSNKEADKLIENLKKQVSLYGKTSNVARIRYEIENGSLQNISAKQQQVILNYAKQLDLLQKTKKEIKSINELSNKSEGSNVNAITAQFQKQLEIAKRQANSGSSFLPSSLNSLEQLISASKNNAALPETTAAMQQAVEQLKATISATNSAQTSSDNILFDKTQSTAESFRKLSDSSEQLAQTFKQTTESLSADIKPQNSATDKTQNMGSLTINMITDAGKIAGTIWAETEFIQRLKSFVEAQTNDAARAAIQ